MEDKPAMLFQPNLRWLAALQRGALSSLPQNKIIATAGPPSGPIASELPPEYESDKENGPVSGLQQDLCTKEMATEDDALHADCRTPDKRSAMSPAVAEEFDEQRVSGCNKKFDQLLEEELHRSSGTTNKNSKSNVQSAPGRPFLKRGQGLQRFRGASTAQPIAARHLKTWKPSTNNRSCRMDAPVSPPMSSHSSSGSLQRTCDPKVNAVPLDQEPVDAQQVRMSERTSLQQSMQDRTEKPFVLHDTIEDSELEEFEFLERAADNSVCSLGELARVSRKSFQRRSEERQSKVFKDLAADEVVNVDINHWNFDDPETVSTRSSLLNDGSCTSPMRRKVASSSNRNSKNRSSLDTFEDEGRWSDAAVPVGVPSASMLTSPEQKTKQTILNDITTMAASATRGPVPSSVPSESTDAVKASLLREKLQELEAEIGRFRTENATLLRLRKEQESCLSELKKERSELAKQKTQVLKEVERGAGKGECQAAQRKTRI